MLLTSRYVFETPAALRIYRSLKPELESQVTERSSVYMNVENSTLYLEIRSDDLVAMRSTLNTWLRLIQVASETADCLV
ncbi:MAG: complex subunit Pcc1 [Methanolobus sp.]|uniref:Transcription factor Pcc1 n=1 Tax=Methanolobus tindarius DSM 2278 TaxID=1090322 RepID=W9DPN8_METTI|nr:KEOPS complex subunit Pcc1 [Methanolobus tindarius]ETA67110.1 Transcription factor Pcc1 [Methanolobus tindarius DSM 2278]MDI3485464.1 complex subunit Pcc1 [Methanolobus sp.]MDK2939405.1 complex subunit Pcc1 [Methanolobus sp.]